MNAGAKGVKIICGGRLGGAEIARTESQKMGSIPLQTLDANVDYAAVDGQTTYGAIGIKVWIYKASSAKRLLRSPRSEPSQAGGGRGGGRRGRRGGRGGAGGGRGGRDRVAAAVAAAGARQHAAPAGEQAAERS